MCRKRKMARKGKKICRKIRFRKIHFGEPHNFVEWNESQGEEAIFGKNAEIVKLFLDVYSPATLIISKHRIKVRAGNRTCVSLENLH